MSDVPALWGGRPARSVTTAAHALEKTTEAVYRHQLAADYLRECDQIDTDAITDVVRHALEAEMRLSDEGMALAGDSATKRQLLAEKLEILARSNSARISRTFGG